MGERGGRSEDIDAMLEMYGFLRAEITQSNSLQQKLVVGLATFVGFVFSLVFSGALTQLGRRSPGSYQLVIAAVLPIIGVTAGIWLAEQSRVMMAGNYLQFLEHKVHDRTGTAPMSWENWLRRDDAFTDQETYNIAYLVGYVCFFLVVGFLSILLYLYEVILASITTSQITVLDLLKIVWPLVWWAILLLIAAKARQVLSHATKDKNEAVFRQWERREFRDEPSLSEAFKTYPNLVEEIEFEATSTEDKFRELLEKAQNQ